MAEPSVGGAASSRNEEAAEKRRSSATENCGVVRKALMTGKNLAHRAARTSDSSPWSWTALRRSDLASAMTEESSQLTKTPTVLVRAGILRRMFHASEGDRQRWLFS